MGTTTLGKAAGLMVVVVAACGKPCEEVPVHCSAAERAWISYAPGQTIKFMNALGDTGILGAGTIESRMHYGGGSKGDCSKNFESLHQPLAGLGLPADVELAVVHDRETGNAPGYVCGPYMNMAPVNGIVVNGVTYNEVYISLDSNIWFNKSAGLLHYGDWRKLP